VEVSVPPFDLAKICQECSEADSPAEAMLISGNTNEHVLAINLQFLEEGQQLPCPGLPLAGAVFDPSWGFTQIEMARTPDGATRIHLPLTNSDDLSQGSIFGYRVCVIEDNELASVTHQLARIRAELGSLKNRLSAKQEDGITLSSI